MTLDQARRVMGGNSVELVMPKCTECSSSGEIGKFVYSRTKDREGFDLDVTDPDVIDFYLVCPDCDAILGGLESVDYTADIDL